MKPATITPEAVSDDPVARFAALAAETRAKLELALELTDFPCTVAMALDYLARLDHAEKEVRDWGNLRHLAASSILGTWGRNGRGPAIDGILSSARFHGKPWRPAYEARLADARVSA